MSDLILPGHQADEFDVGVAELDVALSFRKLLKALDDKLGIFWAKPGGPLAADDGTGRWYIYRQHPNPELTNYWVVEDEHGNYSPPQERHIDRLRQMDTWSGQRTYSDFELARSAKKRARQKAQNELRRELREKLEERLAHINDARVSVPRAISADGKSGLQKAAEAQVKKLVLPDGVSL